MNDAVKNEPNLRGHHLICLHFFHGEGYGPDFVRDLWNILRRAEEGGVSICSGPDDVCVRCPHLFEGRCRYNERAEEEIGEMDRMALELLGLSSRMSVEWAEIGKRIPAIFREWHAACCTNCDWRWACEEKAPYREMRERMAVP